MSDMYQQLTFNQLVADSKSVLANKKFQKLLTKYFLIELMGSYICLANN